MWAELNWTSQLATCTGVKSDDLPRILLNKITSWSALKMTQLRKFMSLKIFRSTYRQRLCFLNKSLIPSSGLNFKHKCCWKSSQHCSDVLPFGSQSSSRMAAGAPIQEVGSQTLRRAQCRMQSKEARDAQFPDKHRFLYKKESSTLIEVLNLPQDRSLGRERSLQ